MNPFEIRPLRDRIIVEYIPHNEQTAGGLFIPDVVREKENVVKATVISIGPKCQWVKPDDLVIIMNKNFKTIIKHEGKEYSLLQEGDVVCYVEDEAKLDFQGQVLKNYDE